VKDSQQKVAEFVQKHELEATPAFRLIDLFAELGEIASEAAGSTEYGAEEDELEVSEDELGDTLFSPLSFAEAADIDAEQALETSLDKYRERIDESGSSGVRKLEQIIFY